MWKKANLADPQILAAVAARFSRKSKKKETSFSIQHSGVAKSGLHEKKIAKKRLKKGEKQLRQPPIEF
jgi:hypothetical protein